MDPALPVLPLYGLLALAVGTLAPRTLQPILAALFALGALVLATPEPDRSEAIQRWLETRYDRRGVDAVPDPAGIIVLGGGLSTYVVDVAMNLPLDDRGRSGRITGAAELARRFPRAKVVHSGQEGVSPRAEFVKLGVADERIVVEDRSTSTFENAVATAALLAPRPGQRWILVTSAFHMPRAVATFRSVGFDVVAYPVDFEADLSQALPLQAQRAAQANWPRGRSELLAIAGYAATGRLLPWRLLF